MFSWKDFFFNEGTFFHYVLLLLTECEIKNVISKTTLEDVLFSYLFILPLYQVCDFVQVWMSVLILQWRRKVGVEELC